MFFMTAGSRPFLKGHNSLSNHMIVETIQKEGLSGQEWRTPQFTPSVNAAHLVT